MLWENIKNLSNLSFRRLTGVEHKTFNLMLKAVKADDLRKAKKRGNNRSRPFKLSFEDQILLTLMYYREYRTMFHIAIEYGISEASVSRTIDKIESIINKIKQFQLPGKDRLNGTNHSFEVVIVDATESPIERPKKTSIGTTQVKRKSTR